MTAPGYNFFSEKMFSRRIRASKKTFRHLAGFTLVCAFLFFQSLTIKALDPRKAVTQYVHDAWTTNDGLPQDSVNAVAQTADGYIWFATQEGLVRFDGVRFTVFDTRNSHIIDNFIFALYADPEGTLWVSGKNGLGSYRDGKFTTHFAENGEQFFSVKNISGDAGGNLWLGNGDGGKSTDNRGLIRYKNGRSTLFLTADGLPNAQVNRTYTDSQGNLWIATNNGLSKMKDGKFVNYTTADGLADNFIVSVYEDRAGNVWVGTINGLNRLKDGVFTVFSTKDGLSDNRIRVIYEDTDGNLWIGTDKGLNRFYDGRISPVSGIEALAEDQILSILEDAENSLWIGTRVHGLQRLRDGKFTPYGSPEGLLGDSANVIYEDRAGRIWIGTAAPGGLSVLENNQFKTYSTENGLSVNNVLSVYEDGKGVFWIGTSGGLNEFKNGRFAALTSKNGLAGDYVRSVYEDRNGTLWIGTNVGLSLFKDNKFVNLSKKDGLAADSAKFTFEDSGGRLWIGGDGGLTVFENGKFTPFRPFELAEVNFQSVIEDENRVLWFTTWGQGLLRVKNNELTTFTTKNGLYDDVAWSILDDRQGNFWMSGNRGIFRVSKQSLNDFADGRISVVESIVYGTADGMRKRETNAGGPSALRSRDGRLWFATTGGVVVIDPRNIKINRVPPPVIIEKIIADELVIASGEQNVELAAGTRNVEFQYVGLSFVSPERVQYKYKLEGFDKDWIDAETRHAAYYTNLPPGDYEFKIIAANNDGLWNERGAQIRFGVAAPFWRTWWFYGLAGIFCAGIVYTFFEWRTARLRRANARQAAYSQQLIESQERERQRIAVELHDGLGQSLVVIKNRALISLNAPENHERMLSQMTDISEAASAAIAEVRGIARNLHPYQIEYLGLTTALRTMIKSLADASEIEIQSEIDELDGELSKQSEINLYRIVQEALNNVAKHSAATRASVSLKKNGRVLDLLIEDNGIGFSPDAENIKSGLGLIGIGERARILNARHEIRSIASKGTTVFLQMNLPEQKSAQKSEKMKNEK